MPERAGDDERDRHRDEEVAGEEAGQIVLEQMRGQIGHVGAEDHELAVRHVDHAHLAEDDRETERHQHEDGEQDQAGKALHRRRSSRARQANSRRTFDVLRREGSRVARESRRGAVERGPAVRARERCRGHDAEARLLVALRERIRLHQVGGLVDQVVLAVELAPCRRASCSTVMVLVDADVAFRRALELDAGRSRRDLVDVEASRPSRPSAFHSHGPR